MEATWGIAPEFFGRWGRSPHRVSAYAAERPNSVAIHLRRYATPNPLIVLPCLPVCLYFLLVSTVQTNLCSEQIVYVWTDIRNDPGMYVVPIKNWETPLALCGLSSGVFRNLKPNTHTRRDETVLSRRVGVGGMYMNSQLAHDDCRRIRRCERSRWP